MFCDSDIHPIRRRRREKKMCHVIIFIILNVYDLINPKCIVVTCR